MRRKRNNCVLDAEEGTDLKMQPSPKHQDKVNHPGSSQRQKAVSKQGTRGPAFLTGPSFSTGETVYGEENLHIPSLCKNLCT